MLNTKDYIKKVKSLPCLVCGQHPVDPDHLDHRGSTGKGETITNTFVDYSCVPLCRGHHSERHTLGVKKFQDKYRINLWKAAHTILRRYFVE